MKTDFIVHKADGKNHVFTPSKKRLFFSDDIIDTVPDLVKTVD